MSRFQILLSISSLRHYNVGAAALIAASDLEGAEGAAGVARDNLAGGELRTSSRPTSGDCTSV